MTLPVQKLLFRKQFKTILSAVTKEQIEEESEMICNKVIQRRWLDNANRIGIFVSTNVEVSTEKLIRQCLSLQKKVFIPRFERGNDRMEMLRLFSVEEYKKLSSTLWGIRQHERSALVEHFNKDLRPNERPLDIIFMPGLAFTSAGQRIGHGKGFYDRFINEYRLAYAHTPLLIGLALKAQIVDGLPDLEQHDVVLDHVVHA